ncbi:ABC transporter ATP-binding protein [Anaeromicropila populeti]|uniref:ABC-2 type transport system ATP-binding protein n=1 Tax=Anaeromicropila populeti TaxID=37658 RepID=A0A1I6HRM8_9FIRM|nr:ABC transporter ATP-binding protein [Anaeromicropila populeti]SFR57109.1 ABC-2 type transport system ATP-binding protein [Anaeromicropila populeti]
MIEVTNLVKKYDNYIAVDQLSFTLEKGKILGFLGPNGAGKSTTMNMITGYIAPTEGTIRVNGYEITEEPEIVKQSIGYLPEIPPIYPEMKVKEYLEFVADLKGVKKTDKIEMIHEIEEMTGLTEVQERLIRYLSKGFKQRVGLAGAIMGYPELIILDEPTVGLDPVQIIEIRDLIKKLSEKHTIILSSHILSEVSAVCDEVMIINKGRFVVRDTPDNLVKQQKGATGIELSVKASKEAVEQIITEIEEIQEIKFIEKETSELVHCKIFYSEEEELREKIFYAFAKAECPIYEMKGISTSLEEIFLQLTKEAEDLC